MSLTSTILPLRHDLLELLGETGLSENQARLYLAALSHGAAPLQALARAAEMKRTTAYAVAESLEALGLMRAELKGSKRRYGAEPPAKLKAIMERRMSRLEHSIDELSALYTAKPGESSIRYYEGVHTIRTIYSDLLADAESGRDYLIISSPDKLFALDPEFFPDFVRRRSTYGFKLRYMMIPSAVSKGIIDIERTAPGHEVKLLPKSTGFTANLVIIPKKVVIHQLMPPIWAAIIEDKHLVRMMTEIFNLLWDSLPALD